MPVFEITRANLEPDGASQSQPPMKKASYNLFDAIKRTSSRLRTRKSTDAPQESDEEAHTYTGMTASMSHSSEGMAPQVSKNFSLFNTTSLTSQESRPFDEQKPISDVSEPRRIIQEFLSQSIDESDDDDTDWRPPAIFRDQPEERERLMSPAERTSQILHNLASPASTATTTSPRFEDIAPVYSTEASSWDQEDVASGSLLDADLNTDGESVESLLEEDDDDESAQSQDTKFDEYGEEEGIAAFGAILYQIGTCTFQNEVDFDEEDEEYSLESPNYLGFHEQTERTKLRRSIERRQKTPRYRTSFLQTVFGCK